MTKYAQDIEDVYNDLKESGVEMILVVETQGEYNPATGSTGPSTIEEHTTYGIWKKKSTTTAGEAYLDGTLIKSKDKFAMVAAHGLPVRPSSSHKLRVLGNDFEILNAKALEPDGEPIFFDLHVRC